MDRKYDFKNLEKHKLESTNLDWVAYNEAEQVLFIAFLPHGENGKGSVYAYDNVPKDIFERLLNAGSHGRYFWVAIRDKKQYPYRRLI